VVPNFFQSLTDQSGRDYLATRFCILAVEFHARTSAFIL
jgi:hypothetical protein